MRIFVLFFIVLISIVLLNSCYYTTQGYYLLSYTYSAKKIKKLLEDPKTSEDTSKFLNEVLSIKEYSNQIGLNGNKKYNTYKELEQEYLVAVVQAAGKLSVTPYKWSYPFFGELPYKGYYNIAHAKKEAEKLKKQDYDVLVRPVSAFSTLNILPDPLFSFMKKYSTVTLAEMLIHEQVHATIWLKNHDAFNEQLASFIGYQAMLSYMKNKYGEDSEEYANIFKGNDDSKRYIEYLLEIKNRLKQLYEKEEISDEKKLLKKQEILEHAQDEFVERYSEMFSTDKYKKVRIDTYNNAFFALISTYKDNQVVFQQAFDRCNGDITYFISQVKLVNSNSAYKKDPYAFLHELPL